MKQEIIFQRVEMFALFVAATTLYFWLQFSWWIYLLLLLSFDISMVGYLANKRLGAFLYNVVHSFFPYCSPHLCSNCWR